MILTDHPRNPLVRPPFPSPFIADPSVLAPDISPDRLWHIFAHSLFGLHHYTSQDGISWKHYRFLFPLSIRPYIYSEKGNYYLLYEKLSNISKFPYYDSHLEFRTSTDLFTWSKPTVILIPGSKKNTGNPCLIKHKNIYHLFYSTGLVYLPDCHFCEPEYVIIATSDNLLGPYQHRAQLSGVTSSRVMKLGQKFIGLQTILYFDPSIQRSRAAIRLAHSKNLLDWTQESDFIIKPDRPWKKSHIYVGDLVKHQDEIRIYYNARNGWLFGTESIGLSLA